MQRRAEPVDIGDADPPTLAFHPDDFAAADPAGSVDGMSAVVHHPIAGTEHRRDVALEELDDPVDDRPLLEQPRLDLLHDRRCPSLMATWVISLPLSARYASDFGLVHRQAHRLLDVEVETLRQAPVPDRVHDLRLPDDVDAVGSESFMIRLVVGVEVDEEARVLGDADTCRRRSLSRSARVSITPTISTSLNDVSDGIVDVVRHATGADQADADLAIVDHGSHPLNSPRRRSTRPRRYATSVDRKGSTSSPMRCGWPAGSLYSPGRTKVPLKPRRRSSATRPDHEKAAVPTGRPMGAIDRLRLLRPVDPLAVRLLEVHEVGHALPEQVDATARSARRRRRNGPCRGWRRRGSGRSAPSGG